MDNRAKCYAPFDALRGFSLAILTKQVEQQLVDRITLSEDAQAQLDQKLRLAQAGDTVTVVYFQMQKIIGGTEFGTYITTTGQVEDIDIEDHILILSQAYISIPDIIALESCGPDTTYADPEVELYG